MKTPDGRERADEERTDLSGVYGWRFGWLPVAGRMCLVEGQGTDGGRGLGLQPATPKGVPRKVSVYGPGRPRCSVTSSGGGGV